MRTSILVVPLLIAGCSYPKYVASKVVEYSVPAAGVSTMLCQTHNGGITVTGDGSTNQVEVRAELSVRGYSQAEADTNLHLLEVVREESDGTLHLFGKYPEFELSNRSPSFAFTLKVPQHLIVRLESHNGDLVVRGTRGKANFETHNGSVDATIESPDITTLTHNGDVRLCLTGDGALNGEVTSHNGSIELSLAEGMGTMLDAQTHNGRITPPAKIMDATATESSLRGRLGDGTGAFKITTHNGNVQFR